MGFDVFSVTKSLRRAKKAQTTPISNFRFLINLFINQITITLRAVQERDLLVAFSDQQ